MDLLGQQQVVIKSMETNYKRVQGCLWRYYSWRWFCCLDPGYVWDYTPLAVKQCHVAVSGR